jgi:hypothetical protein
MVVCSAFRLRTQDELAECGTTPVLSGSNKQSIVNPHDSGNAAGTI